MTLQNILEGFSVLLGHFVKLVHDHFLLHRRRGHGHHGSWQVGVQRPVFGASVAVALEKVLIVPEEILKENIKIEPSKAIHILK